MSSGERPCPVATGIKSPTLYHQLLLLWAVLLGAAAPSVLRTLQTAWRGGPAVGVLAVISTLFVGWFWLNGLKDLVYTLYYHVRRDRLGAVAPVRQSTGYPSVVMVYCTCNDFDGASLAASLRQDYPNYRTVILDDSKDPGYMERVDAFAAEYGLEVVRRSDRVGFKAGNLNNYLRTAEFDYFVILDSDEIIPPDFISRALDYFEAYPQAGIVQANHIATRNDNRFMTTFAPGVDSHWPAYQSVKHRFGFLSLLGHGAMVSRVCYQEAGGFPHVVAEDLCLSIRARVAGFLTVFAADIVCSEAYPVDYLAFKKRHSKWTQGNMEFIKRFSGEILRAPIPWFEKLDIALFTYSLPLTAFFFFYLLINVVVLPAMGASLHYSPWLLAPTVAFLAAPMLNDMLTYRRHWSLRRMLSYLLHTMGLYGSMFFTSLRASTKSLFGGSVFIVTPKNQQRLGVRDALRANLPDLVFCVGLLALAVFLDGSVLPVVLIATTGVSSMYLTMLSNQATRQAVLSSDPLADLELAVVPVAVDVTSDVRTAITAHSRMEAPALQ